ncbi:MAG: ABC transporter ATP-binding protein [Micromonosporaceae bacterium]
MKVQLEGLVKSFGNARAVDDISLTVNQGEFMVLLGPSGCGKTTTLRMLAGFETPDAGVIRIGDQTVADPSRRLFVPPERRGVGMVFQSYAIWPHMTVFENVAYPLRVRRVKRSEVSKKVEEVLDLVGLHHLSSRSATALSGGQMQRVALARALVYDPTVLLLDEPLSNLDVKLRDRLREELKQIQQRAGVTSLYVTHDQAEAVELGDHVVVMDGGRVVESGTPEELWAKPRTAFVADFIGSANLVPGKVAGSSPGQATVALSDGSTVSATAEAEPGKQAAVTLAIRPEDCQLTRQPVSKANTWSVEILERRFQGVSVRYVVDWGGVALRVVCLGAGGDLQVGKKAHLSVPVDRVRVVAE